MDYKKVMTVAGALICASAMADVVSSSVVGYTTVQRPTGYQNSFGGSFFLNCGSDSYSLADIQISGPASKANGRNNYIAFMSSSGMKLDKARSYWWDPVALKWRVRSGTNFNNDPEVSDPSAVEINPGEGFLCSFMHNTTKVTYSGEVLTGTDGKFTVTRPEGYQNFVTVNTSGAEISLSQITISGPATKANGRNNYIAFMSDTGMKIDKTRSYWWDPVALKWRVRSGTNFNNDPDVEDATQVKIGVGEGFMCSFMHATTTITLPTSL